MSKYLPYCRVLVLLLTFVWVVSGAAQPANDNFSAATSLVGNSVVVSGSNAGATRESGEPAHAGDSGSASVWWQWTLPSDSSKGRLTIDLAGSSFDTLLAVYTGSSVDSLTPVASNDDAAGTGLLSSRLSVLIAEGMENDVPLHIAVDGFAGETGTIELALDFEPEGNNDNAADAILLSGELALVTGSNVGATREPNEPTIAANAGGASIWYAWEAPEDGSATFSTIGSVNLSGESMDTLVALHTNRFAGDPMSASDLNQLVGGADDDGAGNGLSLFSFQVTAGVKYFIAVDGKNDGSGAEMGTIRLCVSMNRPATIANLQWQANGTATMDVITPSSCRVWLEASGDLVVWSRVATLNHPGGTVPVTDTTAPGNPIRFYRASTPGGQ